MKYTAKEKDAMTAIGHYYLNMYSEPDDYPNLSKAKKAIKNLLITRVIYSDSELDIYLGYPDLIIGPRGENIDRLREFLKTELDDPKLQIHINEDRIYDYLIPVDYSEYDFVGGEFKNENQTTSC
jgi:ribosomal protein S3